MYPRVLIINSTEPSRRTENRARQLGVPLETREGTVAPGLCLRSGYVLWGEADVTTALELIAGRERR